MSRTVHLLTSPCSCALYALFFNRVLTLQVTLPPALTGAITSADPKIRELQEQLNDVNRKILNNELDIPPEGERSPSPPPRYDQNGQRLNTREVRYKDKLMDRRSFLIEEMIKADPSYRPPADYRPRKKERKIFIPQKDYPGYNFIGLIIGPRGNTQKRMQKETNTKIAIRGRGSVKEGAARDPKYDYGEEEELHVLISGDTQQDVSLACCSHCTTSAQMLWLPCSLTCYTGQVSTAVIACTNILASKAVHG